MKITKQQLKRIIREARFDDNTMRADTVRALWAQIDEVATTFSSEFMPDLGSMSEEKKQNVLELERQIVLALEGLEVLFEDLALELQ
jgi:hypothetical protein